VLAGPGASVTPPGHRWFTALQIPPWAIIDAKLAVDAAARQAARHFVEAGVPAADDFGEAEAEARLAGYEALAAQGADRARSTVKPTGRESPDGQAGFTRCARATFTASYDVPVLCLPWIGGFGSGLDVTSSYRRTDRYVSTRPV
jgi:hypothetical protein